MKITQTEVEVVEHQSVIVPLLLLLLLFFVGGSGVLLLFCHPCQQALLAHEDMGHN